MGNFLRRCIFHCISMKIQYCSDLHLEFQENADFLENNPLKPVGEVLLLAGDAVPFTQMQKHPAFFDFVSDSFKWVYWLPGNHEYYHFDIANKSGSLNEKIRDNVFLVNNHTVQHQQVRFIFSTLWSKISSHRELKIQRGMSDFHAIKLNGKRFTAVDYNKLHLESKDFISNTLLQRSDGKTVVVTHHVPTFRKYPQQYLGDVLNEAFAVELEGLIEASNADYWIYGHHHQHIPEFEIGSTKLITNQLGYVRYNEHIGFRGDSTFVL